MGDTAGASAHPDMTKNTPKSVPLVKDDHELLHRYVPEQLGADSLRFEYLDFIHSMKQGLLMFMLSGILFGILLLTEMMEDWLFTQFIGSFCLASLTYAAFIRLRQIPPAKAKIVSVVTAWNLLKGELWPLMERHDAWSTPDKLRRYHMSILHSSGGVNAWMHARRHLSQNLFSQTGAAAVLDEMLEWVGTLLRVNGYPTDAKDIRKILDSAEVQAYLQALKAIDATL